MNINTIPKEWPSVSDLKYFQDIAITGNLSRSSEKLHVGQPALSLSLKRLESLLDTKLFYRRNRGLQLTPSGQRLLRESNRLLHDWENVISETRKSETELVGRFRLGCHPSVAIYALDLVLKTIYSKFNKIEIELVHDLSREITEKVITGIVDFGIAVNPMRHPDLVIHTIATDEVCLWRNDNALKDVLIYHPELNQSQSLIKRLPKGEFTRTVKSTSLEVVAALAKSGLGTAILPTRVAKANASNLRRMPKTPIILDEITFIYRSDIIKTQSSKALITFFKALKI